eukprot:CAMPEP_0206603368 /NCGR_PEP_ID=MMETSP0325_2-20121206/48315_1 /ASSEMBLY_ACC=CAM_ASM_000347 /TAXON_ID=2866 /ORGANISM="Crypthecodinium cohnii, Strain Seligo" /LENGTH=31 /DNA_ID= /DNA_START= /DNA_END= /DNA_ORIENTATION=
MGSDPTKDGDKGLNHATPEVAKPASKLARKP